MQINITIDDQVIRDKVADIIAQHFFGTYRADSRLVRKVVGEQIKTVLDENREEIVKTAIDQAAGKIYWDFTHGRYVPAVKPPDKP